MKTQNTKLDINVNELTFTSKDNTILTLTKEDYEKVIYKAVYDLEYKFKSNAESIISNRDIIYDFEMLSKPITNLLYDETNKETYPSFVHHFLKNYYVDSYDSRHYTNGGHWQHARYDPKRNMHSKMINDNTQESIKDLIITHLVSGGGVRMYGNPQYYKRVIDLHTTEELKNFFKFILDSKMFNVNDRFVLPDKLKKENEKDKTYVEKNSSQYSTIGELLILECWRNKYNFEVLQWLVETYQLELKNIGCVVCHIIDKRVHKANYLGEFRESEKMINSYENSILFINYLRNKSPKASIVVENIDRSISEYKNVSDLIESELNDLNYNQYKDMPEKLDIRMKAEKKGLEEFIKKFM